MGPKLLMLNRISRHTAQAVFYPQDREKRPQKQLLCGDFHNPSQSLGSVTFFKCSVYADFPLLAPFTGAWGN